MKRAMRCLAGVLVVSGCHSIGPTTVPRDHFDYNAAISESWKEEMLLNMVRLRYGEAPVFLDVASVIAQYSLEAQAQVNAQGYDRPNTVGPPIASGALRWSDRPTITYQPRTGQQLARTLLTPLPIGSVFALIQAGWPLDAILGSTLRTMNGLPARAGATGRWNAPFLAAIDAVNRVVELGAGSVRQAERGMVFVIHDDLAADARDAVANLRQALDLDPAVSEYAIVSSPFAEWDPLESTCRHASLSIL